MTYWTLKYPAKNVPNILDSVSAPLENYSRFLKWCVTT